ncbi:MAG: tetratricopeptide repeat protein [Myxococcota bacterium]
MTRTTPEVAKARAAYHRNRRAYTAALRGLSGRVRTLLAKEGLAPIITHRVKEFDSYLAKLARLRQSQPRTKILVRDLLGLRVVCPFLDETERVRELLVRHFRVAEIEHKGADRPLAEFGYESVHLLVRLPRGSLPTIPRYTRRLCEVQVCTILQHAWAQIEHELVYKADRSLPKSAVRRKLAAVSATLTLADVVFQETRDDLTDLHERGVQRRESAHGSGVDAAIEPVAATPREVTLLARRDRTLPDPKMRDLESRIMAALRAHSDGDLEHAIRLYGDVLRLRLSNPAIRSMIYNHRGIAHLTRSRPARAIRDFTNAVRWNGENFRAYYNLGIARRAVGKPALALGAFRRALGAHEIEGEAHYAIAQVLAELGQRREARTACERALALKPTLQGARTLRESLERVPGRR